MFKFSRDRRKFDRHVEMDQFDDDEKKEERNYFEFGSQVRQLVFYNLNFFIGSTFIFVFFFSTYDIGLRFRDDFPNLLSSFSFFISE